jgi:hypothetical protein
MSYLTIKDIKKKTTKTHSDSVIKNIFCNLEGCAPLYVTLESCLTSPSLNCQVGITVTGGLLVGFKS